MVVHTELCSFSEYKIYPGHGLRFIRKDGQPVMVGTSKSKSMMHQRKRAAKLHWTQGWRRLNRKGRSEIVSRRRTRRTHKFQRAIVGASVDEIRRRRKPITRRARGEAEATGESAEAGKKEIKQRKRRGREQKQGGNVGRGAQKHQGGKAQMRQGGLR